VTDIPRLSDAARALRELDPAFATIIDAVGPLRERVAEDRFAELPASIVRPQPPVKAAATTRPSRSIQRLHAPGPPNATPLPRHGDQRIDIGEAHQAKTDFLAAGRVDHAIQLVQAAHLWPQGLRQFGTDDFALGLGDG